jgi:DNA primase
LAERAGVSLKEYNPEKEGEKEKLYRVNEESAKFFENNLRENEKVIEYLKSRGLTDKSIKDFRIGFAKADWRFLYAHLEKKGFSVIDMEKGGVVKKSDNAQSGGERFYDRFRSRIMFPISDSSGRVIAFSGRIFEEPVSTSENAIIPAKYLNSPETLIFNKSSVLFGIDKAKDAIRKNNFSILVEGQFDLILSHQAGFKNTVASSGTAMTSSVISKENIINNLGLITRMSKNIVLAYDADKAGISASNRFARIALSLGMDVKAAMLPEGMDPADVISKLGVDTWKEAIRNSKHFIEFMLMKIFKETSNDFRKTGKEIKEKLLPLVNDIESSIEKSHFISLISSKSGIPQSDLIEDLKKVESELKYDKEETKIAKENVEKKLRKDPIERRLLGIAFWQEGMKVRKIDPEIIYKKLGKVKGDYENIKEELIYEVEEFYGNNENLDKDVLEMLLYIEEEYLNEDLRKCMIELEKLRGKEEEIEIFKKINDINKRKEEIKNEYLRK